jgi:hypothetical protein
MREAKILTCNVVYIDYVVLFLFKKQSKKMYNQMKHVSSAVATKSLEREKKVGKMMALVTRLFFLVYIPTIVLRAVII